jgi:outer membrane protein
MSCVVGLRTSPGATFVIACAIALAAAQVCSAETLSDAISLAYETNPTLQAARANQRATDEEYPQAKAGLRPTVQIGASVLHGENQDPNFPSATESTSNAVVQISQPLYTGGRVTSAEDAASADIFAGRQSLRQLENQLLLSVIGAYVDVRRDQEQLAIAQDNVAVLKRQLDETNARFDVGEATLTDTAQARARIAQSEAQLAAIQSGLVIARGAYDSVVGQNPGDLAPEPPISQLLPGSLDAAFDAAEQNNPQLLQARYAEKASAARLAEAKAATRPSIALQGSFGYAGGLTPQGLPANSPFADISRQVVVEATATIPLFSGGMTSSQIRQEAERNNVDRINIEATRRQVLQAVLQAWSQLVEARASLVANEEQVRDDAIAYEGTREEERQDLRTTLDVLNAAQELENSKLALAVARHDEYVAAASVLAAVGSLRIEVLLPSEPQYDPTVNLKRVRNAVGWTPWESVLEGLDHVGAPEPSLLPPPAPPGKVVKP